MFFAAKNLHDDLGDPSLALRVTYHHFKFRHSLFLEIIQPSDHAKPIIISSLSQSKVERFDQFTDRPTILHSKEYSMMCGISFCQDKKVADVEREEHASLRGCVEQLRFVVGVEWYPIVWGARDVVTALA